MENTEKQEETKEVKKFDPSLTKFQNIATTEQLLKAAEVLNNAMGTKVRYIRLTGNPSKPTETVVEHSVWNDEELAYLKGKFINLVNHIM